MSHRPRYAASLLVAPAALLGCGPPAHAPPGPGEPRAVVLVTATLHPQKEVRGRTAYVLVDGRLAEGGMDTGRSVQVAVRPGAHVLAVGAAVGHPRPRERSKTQDVPCRDDPKLVCSLTTTEETAPSARDADCVASWHLQLSAGQRVVVHYEHGDGGCEARCVSVGDDGVERPCTAR